MFKETLNNLGQQFAYQPKIENESALQRKNKFIVCGMGGSNLAAGIIKSREPKLDIIIHRDYRLPAMEETELNNHLVILSSYSGNTEETISAFEEARSCGLSLIVIATGGKLLELAQEHRISYIQIPRIGNHSRFAIGYSIMATLAAMGKDSTLNDIHEWAASFDSGKYEPDGKRLAEKLQNKIPIVYSSGNNAGLARYWKVSFNETAKIPAFYNFWPELNHNEMVGFTPPLKRTVGEMAEGQSFSGAGFAFVFLNDPADPPQIQKRAATTKKLFEEWGYSVLDIVLDGSIPNEAARARSVPLLRTGWQKSFSNIAIAMWTSCRLAESSGVDPEDISTIEDFKKILGKTFPETLETQN